MDEPKVDESDLAERLLGSDEEQAEDPMAGMGEIIVDPLQAGQGLRGESQTPEYRDSPFALGFVVHLMVVFFLALAWGTSAMKQDDVVTEDDTSGSMDTVSLWGLLLICLLASLASIGISSASLELMTRHAEQLIQTCLMTSCVVLGLMVLALFANGAAGVAFFWLFMLVLTCLYSYSVWHRIPFAAINLRTALSAIQTNYGVCMLAYGVAMLANVWIIFWILAFLGVSYKESNGTSCEDGHCKVKVDPISCVLLIISYYWTSQVLQNVLHVTVAGVIGTWWFAPQEANSVFSPGIQDSFRRATSYSFGSICMGSLLVAIIQTLEQLARSARRSNRAGVLLCILECILHYISRIAQYFNKWAFIYVGLYGYDYLTAGKKVLDLFQERGWTAIINDNLVHRTLVLVCLVIGALTGLVGMLLAKATGWADVVLGEDPNAAIFFICFLIGFSLAFILMGVVMSGVDSIIVCFAEAPNEFQTNHPALSSQMMTAWRQVYPQECGF